MRNKSVSIGDVNKNITLFGGIIKDCHRDFRRGGEWKNKTKSDTTWILDYHIIPYADLTKAKKHTSEREIWSKQERKNFSFQIILVMNQQIHYQHRRLNPSLDTSDHSFPATNKSIRCTMRTRSPHRPTLQHGNA